MIGTIRTVLVVLSAVTADAAAGAGETPGSVPRPLDRSQVEAALAGETGCFVLLDLAGGVVESAGGALCDERLSPCSTFKIANALIGLETGVVDDPLRKIPWDGSDGRIEAWKQDLDLAAAIRVSSVPWFRRMSRQVGAERMQDLVTRLDYGNRDTSGGVDRFWLMSSLRISAREQTGFLARLWRDELPVRKAHMATVRAILLQESGAGWSWSGKTGTCGDGKSITHAWFVGEVERGARRASFATLVRGPRLAGGDARRVTREILAAHGWLPAAAPP